MAKRENYLQFGVVREREKELLNNNNNKRI